MKRNYVYSVLARLTEQGEISAHYGKYTMRAKKEESEEMEF